jgi:hypothetical protein
MDKTFKAKLRIPCEMYAFVEVECEGGPQEIADNYREFTRLMRPNEGLPPKEWNKALDTYLETNKMDGEAYEKMSQFQKDVIQEIKRSIKRIDYKNNKVR